MSINDGILVCEICFVITIHEKTACKIIGSLKCPVQIVVVILALHKRIGNIQCPDAQPADDIFIYRLQLIKINRIAHDRNRNLFSVFFNGFHRFSGNRLYRRCILQRIVIIECIVIPGTLPVRCITALQIIVLIGAFFVILIKSIQCPSRIQENTKCNNHQKKTQNITECPFAFSFCLCALPGMGFRRSRKERHFSHSRADPVRRRAHRRCFVCLCHSLFHHPCQILIYGNCYRPAVRFLFS